MEYFLLIVVVILIFVVLSVLSNLKNEFASKIFLLDEKLQRILHELDKVRSQAETQTIKPEKKTVIEEIAQAHKTPVIKPEVVKEPEIKKEPEVKKEELSKPLITI